MTHHALVLAWPWTLLAGLCCSVSGVCILGVVALLQVVPWPLRSSWVVSAALGVIALDCIGRAAYVGFTRFISVGALVAIVVFCAAVVVITLELVAAARRRLA